ncbi:MAG: hypothetical protein JW834_03920 [Candidatus Diapherotrites archaeon]|nr:hypothetical protein [Candidatus Diapherotrites archaeon]
MNKLVPLILLISFAAATLTITAPTDGAILPHGDIAVETSYDGDGEVTAKLVQNSLTVGEASLGTSRPYAGTLVATDAGEYSIRVEAGAESDEVRISVNTSEMFITILRPLPYQYDAGNIDVSVDVFTSTSFVHSATVEGVLEDGSIVTLAEGPNHYTGSITVGPGVHTLDITAVKDSVTATGSVEFTVPGITEEGGVITAVPEARYLEVRRVSPDRGQYALGEDITISVYLIDLAGTKLSDADFNIIAKVKTPSTEKQLKLMLVEDILNPRYESHLVLSESGWYETIVTASKEGYAETTLAFPPMKSGTEPPSLPQESACSEGLCMQVISPEEGVTYPSGKSVELRIQLLEETGNHAPVTDASVTADVAGASIPLNYEWNGFYTNTTGIGEGEHLVMFTASSQGRIITGNATILISPHTLRINPVSPAVGGNVTTKSAMIKAEVLDEEGDIAVDANVRALITTPNTGVHIVHLTRNVSSGYYQTEYTFTDKGNYQLKTLASKRGYVTAETEYGFYVDIPQNEFQVTEQDITLIAIVIGAIIIVATIWKAFL